MDWRGIWSYSRRRHLDLATGAGLVLITLTNRGLAFWLLEKAGGAAITTAIAKVTDKLFKKLGIKKPEDPVQKVPAEPGNSTANGAPVSPAPTPEVSGPNLHAFDPRTLREWKVLVESYRQLRHLHNDGETQLLNDLYEKLNSAAVSDGEKTECIKALIAMRALPRDSGVASSRDFTDRRESDYRHKKEIADLNEALRQKTMDPIITPDRGPAKTAEAKRTKEAAVAQRVQKLRNKAVCGSTQAEWNDRVDASGKRWRDVTLFPSGNALVTIAKAIESVTGYEFDRDLLDDPHAVPDKDGNYRFSIACDSGDLTRKRQKEDFGQGTEDASCLVMAVADALNQKARKGSLFSFAGKTGKVWHHYVRGKKYKANSGRRVGDVASGDVRLAGGNGVAAGGFSDATELSFVVAAFSPEFQLLNLEVLN